MLTPALFRQQFGEFANPDWYSDNAIQLWITLAGQFLSSDTWDTMYDFGVALFTAHRLSLARRAALTSAVGGVPGEPVGLKTAKAVDKVSASYDVQSIRLEGAGTYNMTTYGIELYKLMGQFGSGGLQVDQGFPFDTQNAWYGQNF